MIRSTSQTSSSAVDDRLQAMLGDSSSAAIAALPGGDVLHVAQRRTQPLPQQPAAHAGARSVDRATAACLRSVPARVVRSISRLRQLAGSMLR